MKLATVARTGGRPRPRPGFWENSGREAVPQQKKTPVMFGHHQHLHTHTHTHVVVFLLLATTSLVKFVPSSWGEN